MQYVKSLDLSSCGLRELKNLRNFTSLKDIDLRGNPLSTLPREVVILAAHGKLRNVHADAFLATQGELTFLGLTDSNIPLHL